LNQLLLQYSYLQILDLLTTLAFLLNGVQEGNPLVRWALHSTPHPVLGLALIKGGAIALGMYCWLQGRDRLLTRINLFFAMVVIWNVLAIIIRSYNLL
jgi:hypothetical protein